MREQPTQPIHPHRQHRLRGSLGGKVVGGRELTQWQYEVTGGGRVWYAADSDRRTVWIVAVHIGHPKATE